MKTMRDDPKLPPIAFSHGYLLFRSKIFTVAAQGFLMVFVSGVVIVVVQEIAHLKHRNYVNILNLQIPIATLWIVLLFSLLTAFDTAGLLAGVRSGLRQIVLASGMALGLWAPVFFHWNR